MSLLQSTMYHLLLMLNQATTVQWVLYLNSRGYSNFTFFERFESARHSIIPKCFALDTLYWNILYVTFTCYISCRMNLNLLLLYLYVLQSKIVILKALGLNWPYLTYSSSNTISSWSKRLYSNSELLHITWK